MTRPLRLRPLCSRAALMVALAALAGSAARGFDTGHHADLTFEVLHLEGFNTWAIQAVQVENWLTDYYSGPMGQVPYLEGGLAPLRGQFSALEPEMAKLHFDNLQDTDQVKNYWGWLTLNTRKAVQDAARARDVHRGLALIGLSLHAVQDFYTHSNWVESLQGSPGPISTLRTATFSVDSATAARRDLFTGFYPPDRKAPPPLSRQPHGSYTLGMNHDSYVRPNWLPAYVAAYAASRQWVNAIHLWMKEADPSDNYWRSLQSFNPPAEEKQKLAIDVAAAYKISEWIKTSEHNGHWKGSCSGSLEFVPFVLGWAAQPDSPYVAQVKNARVQRALIEHLASDGSRIDPLPAGTTIPAVPAVPMPHHVLVLRTQHARRLGAGLIPRVANMFAITRITGAGFDQSFVDAMQYDAPEIRPSWAAVKFLPNPQTPVDVEYRLHNEGGPLAGVEMVYGLNGRNQQLRFRVEPLNGRCSGDLIGSPNAQREVVATRSGSGNTFGAEAEVTLAVQVLPVQ